MTDDLTTLSLDDLQAQAAECKAEAEECYRKAHEWRIKAGKHTERLREISLEMAYRQGWLEREVVDKCGIIVSNE